MVSISLALAEGLQCTNPSKHAAIISSLQKVLRSLSLPDVDILLSHVIVTEQFLEPWVSYRDEYLLDPRFNEEGLYKGSGEKMCQLFDHIRREINGRSAKKGRLGATAGGRSQTVRLFSSLIKRLTEKDGFYAYGNKSDKNWLWRTCEQLYMLVKHLRGEYAHGHGPLMNLIEGISPCIWLDEDDNERDDSKSRESEEDLEKSTIEMEDEDASDDFLPSDSEDEEEDGSDTDTSEYEPDHVTKSRIVNILSTRLRASLQRTASTNTKNHQLTHNNISNVIVTNSQSVGATYTQSTSPVGSPRPILPPLPAKRRLGPSLSESFLNNKTPKFNREQNALTGEQMLRKLPPPCPTLPPIQKLELPPMVDIARQWHGVPWRFRSRPTSSLATAPPGEFDAMSLHGSLQHRPRNIP